MNYINNGQRNNQNSGHNNLSSRIQNRNETNMNYLNSGQSNNQYRGHDNLGSRIQGRNETNSDNLTRNQNFGQDNVNYQSNGNTSVKSVRFSDDSSMWLRGDSTTEWV